MLVEYTKFYYHALSKEKKAIYKELYEGFKACKKEISIFVNPHLVSPDDIAQIARFVCIDTPSFYYLNLGRFEYKLKPYGYVFSIKYSYTDSQILEYDSRIMQGLLSFRAKYIAPTMSEYQKEKAIHDYLIKTVKFDHKAIDDTNQISDAYNVLGALLKRSAVCQGIACAFKLICDFCRIKSIVVTGNTIPNRYDAGHAWNIVKLGGESYHVDVTWDIQEKRNVSLCYDYFNLTDSSIGVNHTWDTAFYPKCDSVKQNYYYKNHLLVRTLRELSDFICSRVRANEKYMAVKFVGAMPPQDAIKRAVEKGLSGASRSIACTYTVSDETHNICIEIT